MKTAVRFVLCLLIIASLISFVGCAKKTEPEPQPTVPASPVNEPAAPAAGAKPEVSSPSGEILAAVPLDKVKEEAAMLNTEQLRAKAMEYKNAIVAKKAELTAETAKMKNITGTQLSGADTKTLQTNVSAITKTIANLVERFRLYNDKLKELGGTPVEL